MCIGLLVDNPTFDELSRGVFKQGFIIPYIRNQIKHIQDFFSRRSKASYMGVEVSFDDQEDTIIRTGPSPTLSDHRQEARFLDFYCQHVILTIEAYLTSG